MSQNFRWTAANRYSNLKPSALDGLLAVAADPEIISLAGGMPPPDLLPIEIIRDATKRVFQAHDTRAFQYGSVNGVQALREYIAEFYAPPGLSISAENVLITSGSQQGLDLVSRLLCDPGDVLLTESPTYLGAIQAFQLNQVELQNVPSDLGGAQVNALIKGLHGQRVRGAYLIPNFQNPSGAKMPVSRRIEIADYVNASPDQFIIEDDPYGDLGFVDEATESIASHAPDRTVYLGSFSKRLAPGLRVGWVAADIHLIDMLSNLKQGVDLHTSTFTQYVVLEALKDSRLPGLMNDARKVYSERYQVAVNILERELGELATWTLPSGGMFIWVTINADVDTEALLPELVKAKGVAYVPGSAFYPNGGGKRSFRLNFSANTTEVLEDGVTRLCRFFRTHISA